MRLLLTTAILIATTAFQPARFAHHHSTRPTIRHYFASPKHGHSNRGKQRVGKLLRMSASDATATSEGGGTASIPNEIFNLVKSIVGAGVLSLPAGESCDGSLRRDFFYL